MDNKEKINEEIKSIEKRLSSGDLPVLSEKEKEYLQNKMKEYKRENPFLRG